MTDTKNADAEFVEICAPAPPPALLTATHMHSGPAIEALKRRLTSSPRSTLTDYALARPTPRMTETGTRRLLDAQLSRGVANNNWRPM